MRVASLAKSAHALLPYSAAPHGSAKRGSPHRAERTTPNVSDNGMAACSFRILRHLGLGGLSLDVLVHNLRGQPLRFRRIRRDSRIEQPPPLLGIGEQWNPATASVGFRESVRADCAPPHPAPPIARRLRRCQQVDLYAASTARRDTRRVERFRRSPPIRDENTEQISFPSRHDRQSDHADRTTPGQFHPNMTWCGARRNNGERRRMTKRCKMAVPINQRWPHQRMLRKTSHCVAEPLPHNADLGHFRAGVAMRSSFRSQRDNTRAQ